jgi:hypothetical protein
MLANIKYPVKCRLTISLQNGGTVSTAFCLDERDDDLIEQLYDRSMEGSIEPEAEVVPKQSMLSFPKDSLRPRRTEDVSVSQYKTIDGATVKTDGVKVIKSAPENECQNWPLDCGSSRCVAPCEREEAGVREQQCIDAERDRAFSSVKKRGRPRKKATNSQPETVSSEKNEVEKIQKSSNFRPLHSGEMCRDRVLRCTEGSMPQCRDCVYQFASPTSFAPCKNPQFDGSKCIVCETPNIPCILKAQFVLCQLPTVEHCDSCSNRFCRINRERWPICHKDCDGCSNSFCQIVPITKNE